MKKDGYLLLGLIAGFVVFGFLMLSSASAPYALAKYGDSYYFVKKQFLHGLLPGLLAFWILSRTNYGNLKKYGNYIFGAVILLLVAVLIPGIGASFDKGARSWVKVGGLFAFQPSEFAKLALIIFLAADLEYRLMIQKYSPAEVLPRFLAIFGLTAGLVILQPDLGTTCIISFIALLMYFAAGAPLYYFAGFIAAGAAGIFAMAKAAPYRMARLLTFLNPTADPQGAGYHIMQALLAIGSGRWFGVGFGLSRQKLQYLPEVYADSIFAIAGEELGFFISVAFVILLFLFLYRGIKIAQAAPDYFGKLLATGIVGWIVGQSFINIAAMLSLLPLTGVPLPFVSYGGTALISTLAACGILVNIAKTARN
jgi:cell division protein FtsW